MKKNLLIAAIAITALASCTDETFVGEKSLQEASGGGAISFTGGANRITRATSSTAAADHDKLDNQFRVAGVKSGETAGSSMQKVFNNYGVWFTNNPANTTTSNSSDWEYVETSTSGVEHGSTGEGANSMVVSNQTIKYWDHSAADYRFVAGSPYAAFTFNINETTNAIESATINNTETASYLSGHINPNTSGTSITTQPLYIAKPLIITEGDYSTAYGTKPVTFEFVSQQTQVRVGVYETIPGYKITSISFYPYSDSDWGSVDANHNIILAAPTTAGDYFQGGASANVKGSVDYTWTGDGAPYFTLSITDKDATHKVTKAKNWYGGALSLSESNPLAITSATTATNKAYFYGTDGDMDATTGYFTVFPTQVSTAAPILIKCNYTLTSEVDGSGETINVTGATAAIPDAYTLWKANTSYTYIFKISDNTNGSTGSGKVGLYPITFDAAVIAETAGTQQGTITSVSIPSITTYQAGSVVDVETTGDSPVSTHGIQYKTGTAIYLTVQNNETGDFNTLYQVASEATTSKKGDVKVFKLAGAQTEADLQITAPTGTDLFTLGGENTTVNNVTLTANKYGSFTPSTTGYYAIQYLSFDNGTTLTAGDPTTGYYTRSGSAEPYTYTAATGTAVAETMYYKPVYTYKVVYVEVTGS